MSDDTSSKDYRDRSKIAYEQNPERRCWTEKWTLTNDKKAIDETGGNRIARTGNYLEAKSHI